MELIAAVVEPISPKNLAGKYFPESPDRSYLDDEFMKIGTLQHGEMDWGSLEEQAITLLSKECKDFKVLSYLMLCLQQDGNPERFLSSLQMLERFSVKYWDKGYPRTKEQALKGKLITLMLNRSIENSKTLKLLLSDMPLLAGYQAVIKKLEKLAVKRGLKTGQLRDILKRVKTGLDEMEAPPIPKPEPAMPAATTIVAPGPGTMDLSGERKIKESCLKLAQFANDTDSSNPLGYQLRRYGLWRAINSTPPKSKNGKTEMMAVPTDRVLEYSEAIKNQPSSELLMRIEHTIETSPFWIQGNYMSASCAARLGMHEVSGAILESSRQFLQRIPGMAESRFSDGSLFADQKTLQWLQNKPEQIMAEAVADSFREIYASQGLEATLVEINRQLEKVKEQRDICYLRLMAAEYMSESGLVGLAHAQAIALEEEIKEMPVRDWEPSFTHRMNAIDCREI